MTDSLGRADGLRQRKQVLHTDQPEESPKLLKQIARIDMFPKPKEDFRRQQSEKGAIISTIAVVLISLLVFWELIGYIVGWEAYQTELGVDFGLTDSVPFNIDITFPSIPCHELTIDAMDASGAEENGVSHDLFKAPVNELGHKVFLGKYNYVERRLGPAGAPLGPREHDPRKDPKSPKFCGYCYIEPNTHHHGYDRKGGALENHINKVHGDVCCNTCNDVMAMYDLHGIPRPHMFEIEQCITELSQQNPGCNLQGTLQLRKVKGNFHFSPGHSEQLGPFGQHVHTFSFKQMLKFNVSHIINHFSVGDKSISRFSKRGVTFPLDGTRRIVQHGLAQMKYFVSVVPTSYRSGPPQEDENGFIKTPPNSYEYSVTHHNATIQPGIFAAKTPNLVFVYDFHPVQVNHVFQRKPLGRFLVKLCGIVGGLFVILGLVDRLAAWISAAQQ